MGKGKKKGKKIPVVSKVYRVTPVYCRAREKKERTDRKKFQKKVRGPGENEESLKSIQTTSERKGPKMVTEKKAGEKG